MTTLLQERMYEVAIKECNDIEQLRKIAVDLLRLWLSTKDFLKRYKPKLD